MGDFEGEGGLPAIDWDGRARGVGRPDIKTVGGACTGPECGDSSDRRDGAALLELGWATTLDWLGGGKKGDWGDADRTGYGCG